MKINKIVSAGSFIFSVIILFLAACTEKKSNVIVLNNSSKLIRPDEQIILNRQKLTALFGVIPADKVPELKDSTGVLIPAQADDLDNDGIWDELAFVYTLFPGQSVKINLRYVEKSMLPVYPFRTNVRFAKQDGKGGYQEIKEETMPKDHTVEKTLQRYQLEGPGWENDKIGFRNYFDSRNAMDIFGKRTNEMVLDKTDLNEKVAEYMAIQPWGMDILKVAGSLGAGALGVYEKDSLYRLTGAKTTSYKLLVKGPVRSIFTLSYLGFTAGKQTYNIIQQVSIWAGQPGYQSKVWATGFTGSRVLITGIANIKNKTLHVGDHNAQFLSLYTHDQQSDFGDTLGTALLIPKKYYLGKGQAPQTGSGITQTWYAKLRIINDQPLTFWFVAGWQAQDIKYGKQAYFKELLQLEADRLSQPISIGK